MSLTKEQKIALQTQFKMVPEQTYAHIETLAEELAYCFNLYQSMHNPFNDEEYYHAQGQLQRIIKILENLTPIEQNYANKLADMKYGTLSDPRTLYGNITTSSNAILPTKSTKTSATQTGSISSNTSCIKGMYEKLTGNKLP